MFGVIAWIRADGRKALVVVEGSSLMAAGDPGLPQGQSFTVGDLVFLPSISPDLATFGAGLSLIRPEFWPTIRHEIFQLGTSKAQGNDGTPGQTGNVVNLFAPHHQPRPHRRGRPRIVAAE